MEPQPRTGNPTRPPVFIAGCARSGTTYLRTLLDGHPDIFIPTESLFLIDYLYAGRSVPRRLLQWMFFHEPQLRAWYDGPRFELDDIPAAIERVHHYGMRQSGARIWGQKTPRFVRHMGRFSAAFPGLRWILMYRDPRAVVASMLKSPRHSYSASRGIDRWLNDNRPVIEHLSSNHPPGNVLLVRFEDLVRSPEHTTASILAFAEARPLPFDSLVERGEVVTPRGSRFPQISVRGGLVPDPSILDSWKRDLDTDQTRLVESRCRALMHAMHYELLTDATPSRGARVLDRPRMLLDVVIPFRYLKYWPAYLFQVLARKLLFGLFGTARRQ